MTDRATFEVVPGHVSRGAIALGIERAAARIRAELSTGEKGILVVDETDSSSAALRGLMEDFGIALARGWDPALIQDPRGVAQRLEEEPGSKWDVWDRHLAHSLNQVSSRETAIVLVINPRDESPAARDAARLGADVYMLPRRRTLLPQATGTAIPWRRAIDLTPLLVAAKPTDANVWRREYRRVHVVEHNRAIERIIIGPGARIRAIEPIHPEPDESFADLLARDFGAITASASEKPSSRRHTGGRLTLADLKVGPGPDRTMESWRAKIEILGISMTQLNDPAEWVVGGRMISHDRALQVTRGDAADRLSIQLVWGGLDPRPGEIVRIESDLGEFLDSN